MVRDKYAGDIHGRIFKVYGRCRGRWGGHEGLFRQRRRGGRGKDHSKADRCRNSNTLSGFVSQGSRAEGFQVALVPADGI